MWRELIRHPGALLAAILLNIALIVMLGLGIELDSSQTAVPTGQPIQARLILPPQPNAAERMKAAAAAKAKAGRAEAKAAAAKAKAAIVTRARVAAAAEKAKAAAAAKVKAVREAQARAAKAKKAKAVAAAKARAVAEARARTAAKAKAAAKAKKVKAVAAAKARAVAAVKAKAAEEARARTAAIQKKLMERQLRVEAQVLERRQQALLVARNRRLLARWVQALTSKIQNIWKIPIGYKTGQSCEVTVKQDPAGYILSFHVGRCTGDELFRRSVETAIVQSSPLPLAPSPAVFHSTLTFIFKPE